MPDAFGDLRDLRGRADEDRLDQPFCAGLDRAGQRRLLAGVGHRGRDGSRLRHRSSSCSYFPVPVSATHAHLLCRGRGQRPDRRSRLLQQKREHDGEPDAVQQRLERRLVMLERHLRRSPATLRRIQPKTGPSRALKVKFRKLTTPVAVPLTSGGLASLITV